MLGVFDLCFLPSKKKVFDLVLQIKMKALFRFLLSPL